MNITMRWCKIIYGLIPVLFLPGLMLSGQSERGYRIEAEPVLRTEMIHEYKWDSSEAKWVLKNTVKYDYSQSDGETQIVTTSDYLTGIPSNRVIYRYSEDKILQEALYQDWKSDTWTDNRRDTWIQNSEGLNTETIIQYFLGGVWTNISRYTDYHYEGSRLSRYTFQSWNGTEWVDSFYDSWFYDDNGQLILRTQIRLNDTPVNKFVYELGLHNLRERMTIYSWSGSDWTGFTRRNYEYNHCGKTSATDYQDFRNGEWVNTMRHEYVYSFHGLDRDRRMKVPVCHRGHTIYVSVSAVPAHLAHGDCLGKCLVEEREPYAVSLSELTARKEPPMTVYPVPATDMITVSLKEDSFKAFERIELADYYGNILRSILIGEDNEIIISRGNLAAGVYYLRLLGAESYSMAVVFR